MITQNLLDMYQIYGREYVKDPNRKYHIGQFYMIIDQEYLTRVRNSFSNDLYIPFIGKFLGCGWEDVEDMYEGGWGGSMAMGTDMEFYYFFELYNKNIKSIRGTKFLEKNVYEMFDNRISLNLIVEGFRNNSYNAPYVDISRAVFQKYKFFVKKYTESRIQMVTMKNKVLYNLKSI